MLLRKRAEELVDLMEKTTADLKRLEIFLQLNPMIGAEIVEDAVTGNQMLLIFFISYSAPCQSFLDPHRHNSQSI